MRLARKLLLLAGMALATLAMTASTASAQFELYDEHNNDEHCSDVVRIGHDVSGGCHIEFAGTVDVPLHAYIPQKVTVSNCELYIEAQINEEGEGFVTEAHIDPPHTGAVPCTRTACDEVEGTGNHPMIPWPFHLREHGVGNEEVEAEFCLKTTSSAEGTPGNWCEVHPEFTQIGPHQYEIGHLDPDNTGQEVLCENNPGTGYTGAHALTPAPTSVELHLETVGTEEIGIAH